MADNFREHYADEMQRAMDPEIHALTTIDSRHRMVHDGFVYHTSGKVTGMVNANVDEFLLVTGSVAPHIVKLGFSLGRGDVDILAFEDTTVSANGAELTEVYNTARTSVNTPTMILYSGPTVTGDGTKIHTSWVPPTATGTGLSAAGALVGDTAGEEWELKPNSNYMIRITNNSGSTIAYQYELLWYEVAYEL